MKRKIYIIGTIILLFLSFTLSAHEPNQSYIHLKVYEKDGITGTFELNVRELKKVFGLDLNKKLVVEDIMPYEELLKSYFLERVSFANGTENYDIILRHIHTYHTNLGSYAVVNFKLRDSEVIPENLTVNYNAVFDKDPSHNGILLVQYNFKAGIINNHKNIALTFSESKPTGVLNLTDMSVWKGFNEMVKQGVWHIWIGIDHILFLLALILPSVVRRVWTKNEGTDEERKWKWQAVNKFKPAFWYIIKIITFFTIAHTITLSLASLEIVTLPSRLVESVIALSIGLAALHNIRPLFHGKDWIIAFVFGLFHGFGFATVLGDLGLTNEFLTVSLLGFNIGVEIGQVVIIALIFPVLYLLKDRKQYAKILTYGSIVLIIISLYWLTERVFDINLGVEDYLRRKAYKLAVYFNLV